MQRFGMMIETLAWPFNSFFASIVVSDLISLLSVRRPSPLYPADNPPSLPCGIVLIRLGKLCARIPFNPLHKLQSSNRFYQILLCSIIHKRNMCLIVGSCQLASEPHHGFGCRRFILYLNQFVHKNLGDHT